MHTLGKRAFLDLWKYMNPYRGPGKELCDMLVVFDNHVLIFSIKDIAFNMEASLDTAWARWYKKAIDASAKQIFRAEGWIRKRPNQVFLDAQCKENFPLSFPVSDMQIHRICVALGVRAACSEYAKYDSNLGGNGLQIKSLHGLSQHNQPFVMGQPDLDKGFVHVFDDFALDVVFNEHDTVADFINYLLRREKMLSKRNSYIEVDDEGQMLAYLDLCDDTQVESGSVFCECLWEYMQKHPRYLARKEANKDSYIWDKIIDRLIEGDTYREYVKCDIALTEVEPSLRHLATESRFMRRELIKIICGLMLQCNDDRMQAISAFGVKERPNKAYIFWVAPRSDSPDYKRIRQQTLSKYCFVAKLHFPAAKQIVGLALEPAWAEYPTESFCVLDVENWTDEKQAMAKKLQKELPLLKRGSMKIHEMKEYPE